jgi:hypothetical protein
MKPSHLIQKKCKTHKKQLEVCFRLIDWFVGEQEAIWAIECQNQKVAPKAIKTPNKPIQDGKMK